MINRENIVASLMSWSNVFQIESVGCFFRFLFDVKPFSAKRKAEKRPFLLIFLLALGKDIINTSSCCGAKSNRRSLSLSGFFRFLSQSTQQSVLYRLVHSNDMIPEEESLQAPTDVYLKFPSSIIEIVNSAIACTNVELSYTIRQ